MLLFIWAADTVSGVTLTEGAPLLAEILRPSSPFGAPYWALVNSHFSWRPFFCPSYHDTKADNQLAPLHQGSLTHDVPYPLTRPYSGIGDVYFLFLARSLHWSVHCILIMVSRDMMSRFISRLVTLLKPSHCSYQDRPSFRHLDIESEREALWMSKFNHFSEFSPLKNKNAHKQDSFVRCKKFSSTEHFLWFLIRFYNSNLKGFFCYIVETNLKDVHSIADIIHPLQGEPMISCYCISEWRG